MTSIRVAIVGVGNCASSLVQGVHFYADADPESTVPGLMHVQFGPYHVRDIEFVAAFDVDAKKVGFDLSDAIEARENNTIKTCDAPPLPGHTQRRDVADLDRVVLACPDRIGEVEADLLGVDIKGSDELDVPDVIGPELHMHEAGHRALRVGVRVEMDPLHQ